MGYAFFKYGATLVAGPKLISIPTMQCQDRANAFQLGPNRSRIQDPGNLAIVLLTVIIATTVHVQDFRDVKGDSQNGRHTLPMAHPLIARASVLPLMWIWTTTCIKIWGVSVEMAVPFFALATVIGYRFYRYNNVQADETSYALYNASTTGSTCPRHMYMLTLIDLAGYC